VRLDVCGVDREFVGDATGTRQALEQASPDALTSPAIVPIVDRRA
jgi:hypothetical protein